MNSVTGSFHLDGHTRGARPFRVLGLACIEHPSPNKRILCRSGARSEQQHEHSQRTLEFHLEFVYSDLRKSRIACFSTSESLLNRSTTEFASEGPYEKE